MSDATLGAERALKAVHLASQDHALLDTVGVIVSNALKRMLSHAGSGEVYTRGNVTHQASAPGEPPAVDTGRLRNSIDHAVGVDGLGGFVDVGTNVEYAPYLEYGTSRMAPRPFMRPAISEAGPEIVGLFGERIVLAQRAALAGLPREIVLPDA